MAGRNSRKPKHTEVVLDGTLRIGGVGALHETLLAALGAGQPVVVDAAAVGQVDTASLQLLYAFVADCGRRELALEWRGVGDALRADAARLGLDAHMQWSAATPVSG